MRNQYILSIIIASLVHVILFGIPVNGQQTLFDPQNYYETSGGLYDEDSIREIYLEFYESNYHNVLVNSWHFDPDFRLPAKLLLNGELYDSVAVRYRGNSTFYLPNNSGIPKVPYNIDMNDIVGGQNLLGYKKLKLANAWLDPTFVKEIVSSNIYRKYLPTVEANLIKLNVQGNYLGIYVNLESINKQFLKKHFSESSGVLFKCDRINRYGDPPDAPSGLPANLSYLGDDTTLYYDSYDLKSDYGWGELVELIKVIELDFNTIDRVLNVDRTLWAFAVNQVILNLDCYNLRHAHNYYLYQTPDGLFQMIPNDLDNGFIGALLANDHRNIEDIYEYDPYSTVPGPGTVETSEDRPLLSILLNDPFYRKLYTAHIRTIVNESLDTSLIRSEINHLQELGYDAARKDGNKLFTMQNYHKNVESTYVWAGLDYGFGGIMSTIDARKQYLLAHPEVSLIPPTLDQANVANNYVTIRASNASSVELLATISEYNSKFQAFLMYDDGTNGDALSNDGIYTVPLPFQANRHTVKYYFRAQNMDAIALSPERAEYEFYISVPKVGNIVINEFAASNDNIQADQHGEFDDWLELFNNTSNDIYLDGYFLSDDKENVTKWMFPRGTTIKANDYLIVWADKDTIQTGLHANFKLSASGEELYFSDASGNTVDHILFGEQEEAKTTGRYPNGTGQFTIMPPTFASENSMGTASILNAGESNSFHVFPNPSSDIINITGLTQPAEVKLYSIQGRLVKTKNQVESSLDISDLPLGVYIIQIESGKTVHKQRIIKH